MLAPTQVREHLAMMLAGARLGQPWFVAGMPDNWRAWWDGLNDHERFAIFVGSSHFSANLGNLPPTIG